MDHPSSVERRRATRHLREGGLRRAVAARDVRQRGAVWTTLRPLALAAAALLAAPCAAPRPAPEPPARAAAAAPAAPFDKRLEFAILEDYDKGDDLRDVERDFLLFKQLGITTWRGSFGWDDYEPEAGRYDFAWLHDFAALAARHGITLRPYLGYTPEWAAVGRRDDGHVWNDPPRDLDAWARFAGAIAGALRRHPNVASFEIYNEENVRLWWDGTVEEYAAVVARGAAAVDSAAPGLQVLMGGTVWPDADWVERTCGAHGNADRIDVVPFHAYPETWTPESVTVETYLDAGYREHFLRAVDEDCGGKPIWINETGYATTKGRTERDQAAWWVRAVATFAADRRVAHVGVYEIKDLRPESAVIGDAENYHLGLTRVDRTPKLAFHTVRLLVRLLAGDLTVADRELTVTARRAAGPPPDAHLFRRPDGRQVLIAWVRRGGAARDVDLALARAGTRATEYALDGTPAPVAGFDGRVLRGIRLAPGEPRIFEIAP